jgi:hypothetical protein
VLKKTGIVAAAIAASLLAVTPLAFAGGTDSDKKSDSKDSDDDNSKADDDNGDDDDDNGGDDDDDDENGDDGDDDENGDDGGDDENGDDENGDDAPATINKDNNSTDCDFVQATGDTNGTQTGGNAGLLGVVNLAANLVAPISAQAPLLNCNNLELEDTVDVLTINPSSDTAEIDG